MSPNLELSLPRLSSAGIMGINLHTYQIFSFFFSQLFYFLSCILHGVIGVIYIAYKYEIRFFFNKILSYKRNTKLNM